MEILIYIAVLAMIILAVSVFFTWTIKTNAKVKVAREVLDNAQRVMAIMTYEIKEAKSIYTPTSTSTQLSLETTHYLPSGESSSYIDFYLCGTATTTLCFKKESQDLVVLTFDRLEVNNLEFTLIGTTTPSVKIDLGINFKNPQNRPEYQAVINLTSTVSLRSY